MPLAVVDLTDVSQALGAAILHFVWQGAAVGVLVAMAMGICDRRHAVARHHLAWIGLAACAVLFVGTFAHALQSPDRPIGAASPAPLTAAELEAVVAAMQSAVPADDAPAALGILDVIAGIWCAGVVLIALRTAGHLAVARRLVRDHVDEPDRTWRQRFESLRREIGVHPSVRLVRSAVAEVPMVVGWLSPVVVVPAAAFTSLTPDQLRAVLAHELAHIHRRDHLLNALQIAIETVLFFHPVTWWLSNCIRTEREHCCDDAAVRTTPHPRVLAEALAQLEHDRIAHSPAALAATGGPLMNRITRIIGVTPTDSHPTPWRSVIALTAGAVVAIGGLVHAAESVSVTPTTDAVAALSADDPTGAIAATVTAESLMIEALRSAAASGMSDDVLRELYTAYVLESSDQRHAVEQQAADIAADLAAAVAAGQLSPKDADEKRAAIEADLAARLEMEYFVAVRGYTKAEARLAVVRERLNQQILDGTVSHAVALERLAKLEREVELRREIEEARRVEQESFDAAVAAGKMTAQQAKRHLEAIELERRTKERTNQITLELDAMVAAGAITPVEAKKKIAEFRAAEEAKRAVEIELDALAANVEAAVATGSMSREAAKERLNAARQRADALLADAKRLEQSAGAEIDRLVALATEGGLEQQHARVLIEHMLSASDPALVSGAARNDQVVAMLHAALANQQLNEAHATRLDRELQTVLMAKIQAAKDRMAELELAERDLAEREVAERELAVRALAEREMADRELAEQKSHPSTTVFDALHTQRLDRDQIGVAMKAIERIAAQRRVAGGATAGDAAVVEMLEEAGFTADQIALILGLGKRFGQDRN